MQSICSLMYLTGCKPLGQVWPT